MSNENTEILKALLTSQIRNQAILETVLQTQTRILSKVKKENYEYTAKGVAAIVEAAEKELKEKYELL